MIINRVLSLFILIMAFSFASLIAQPAPSPTYEARLMNDVQVAANQYEFDIYVKRTGTVVFEAFGLQVCLLVNDAVRNAGTFSAAYIAGTSEMNTAQTPSNLNFTAVVSGLRVFKLAAKTVGEPGLGTIISPTGNGTRLGRFRLTTTATAFTTLLTANVNWNFDQATYGYATKFQAWADDGLGEVIVPRDISVPASHSSELNNLPLPVELASFTSIVKQREVNLSWETKTEVSSSMFEVERQTVVNNKTGEWNKIGNVQAAGNSNSTKEYSYIDKKLNSGKYNYRLKMIDNDGTFKYSDAVEAEVELPKDYAVSQNYPNPFNPTTRIDYQLPFDSKVTLELYGITGERIATLINGELSAGYYTADVNASALNLASGVYIYRITAQNPSAQNFVQVKKLMLAK